VVAKIILIGSSRIRNRKCLNDYITGYIIPNDLIYPKKASRAEIVKG
jgi:hypothetical protein